MMFEGGVVWQPERYKAKMNLVLLKRVTGLPKGEQCLKGFIASSNPSLLKPYKG